MFTGNPAQKAFWTEFNSDGQGTPIAPADRRFLASMGPFDMEPRDEKEAGIAIVWARGADNLDSVTRLLASPVFENPFPTSVFGVVSGLGPTERVQLTAPGDGATAQPTNTTLHWNTVEEATSYLLQWATEPVFAQYDAGDADALRHVTTLELRSTSYVGDFAENEGYYWRVLAVNNDGPGAEWSPVYTFGTSQVEQLLEGSGFIDFMVVANANGPLDPPVGAAADWAGFPGIGPPDEKQQVGPGAWLIHTGDNGFRETYEGFLNRSVLGRSSGWEHIFPYDFEWRFTERCLAAYTTNIAQPGCLAWNAFTSLDVIPVPFELWRIGINTPDDSSDDVRLVPYVIDWESDGWGLHSVDHSVSPDNDDPESDWVYWRIPADLTPGESGYETWEAEALALPMGGSGFPVAGSLGDFFAVEAPYEIMGRFVLVNWDGGDVAAGLYNQDLPEPGTIFRIETPVPLPPVLSAPIDGALDVAPATQLWWQGPATGVQVARDAFFNDVVFDATVQGASVAVTELANGETYYWRLGHYGQWSETWTFTVEGGPTSTEPDAIPTDFELAQNYPNPFNPVTTFRFGLPQAGRATLRVYNLLGQEVAVVADGVLTAGWHTVSWNASDLASGVYLYRLEAGGRKETRQMVLLK